MKYRDLVNFDKITEIIQLRESGDADKARELVRSYVVSDAMALRFQNIVFEQLRWDNPVEHFGMLVVGNYGTGKSHLLSVISALASDADMVQHLRNKDVRDAAASVSGKFKVIRCEIGAVKTPLRDIFAGRLQEFLDENGVDFAIPPADAGLADNKGWIEEMMAAFQEKFPDHGLLFVIDEMLDYLRGLPERELTLAFGLMREIGEIAQTSRLRFVAGVQEAIFDSARFSFVADSLRRVSQRFRTIPIERNDVKYVVTERLLSKTAGQVELVRKHLKPFAVYYGDMASRMDDYCAMFPVHPDYIGVFERIACAERREVLSTLSRAIEELLDKEVTDKDPGLIAFDSYWPQIRADHTLQAVQDIKLVADCEKVLSDKIRTLPEAYRAFAGRVVNALSVYRLCTGSVKNHIGLTAENLRDMLCVYDPIVADLGGEGAVILRENIATAIDELKKAVDGQFISRNADNQQYYIDIDKTIDLEMIIRKRAESLDDETLDLAYYEALKVVMELVDTPTKVTGYKIWEFDDLRWLSRKAPRRGYLFFGAPNERSTAQPPRDYYIYFLRPFAPTKFKDEKKPDEVFFRLTKMDDGFREDVRLYAAALDLLSTSSGERKDRYSDRAQSYRKKVVGWLLEKGRGEFEVTCRGDRKRAGELAVEADLRRAFGLRNDETFNFRDCVLGISGHLLEGHFDELAPEYPTFREYISRRARPSAVADALGVLAGGASQNGRVVLDALGLLDGSSIDPGKSPYAERVKNMLADLPEGQVLRRESLLEAVNQDLFFEPRRFRIEDDLLVVVLAALVQSGDIVLSILGRDFDASSMDALSRTPVQQLLDFIHVSRPKMWNAATISAVFDLLGLKKGLVQKAVMGQKEPVTAMLDAAQKLVNRLAVLLPKLSRPLMFMGEDLLQLSGAAASADAAREARDFLDHLLNYDSPAKLKQLQTPPGEIAKHRPVATAIGAWERIVSFCTEQGATLNYLESARRELPPDDAWVMKLEDARREIQKALPAARGVEELLPLLDKAGAELGKLKKGYIDQYHILHGKARLDSAGDARRQKLLNDRRLKTLRELSAIDIMPRAALDEICARIASFQTCPGCSDADIENEALCPRCHYSPVRDGIGSTAAEILKGIDKKLDDLLEDWSRTILNALGEPAVAGAIDLLDERKKSAVREFIKDGDLPDPVPEVLAEGLREALNGLQKVTIRAGELAERLKSAGPASPDEFRAQLQRLVDEAVQGCDRDKVRIVVE